MTDILKRKISRHTHCCCKNELGSFLILLNAHVHAAISDCLDAFPGSEEIQVFNNVFPGREFHSKSDTKNVTGPQ